MTQVLGRQRNKQNRKRIQAFWTSFLKSNKLLDYHCFILSLATLILTIFPIILITLVHTIFISLPMRTRIVEDLFEDSSSNVFYKTKNLIFRSQLGSVLIIFPLDVNAIVPTNSQLTTNKTSNAASIPTKYDECC